MFTVDDYLNLTLAAFLLLAPITFLVLLRSKFLDMIDVVIVLGVVALLVAAFIGGVILGTNVILAL